MYRTSDAIQISLYKAAVDDTEEYETVNNTFNRFMHRIFPEDGLQTSFSAVESSNRNSDEGEETIVNLAAKLNPELKILTRKEILPPKSRTSAQLSSIITELIKPFLDHAGDNIYTKEWWSLMRDENSPQHKNYNERDDLVDLAFVLCR